MSVCGLSDPSHESAAQSHALTATIGGLATALPCVRQGQEELAAEFARLWDLHGPGLDRWRRIVRGSGIRERAAILPIAGVPRLSTAARMRLYEEHAPALAHGAAAGAITSAGVPADRVTDLIVVSCTGFSAPGVDVDLIESLGLRPTVRRLTVGFMGCFGAITGLRAALGVCAADPSAVVVVVCVELCSLHLRATPDAANQVASALFADGAAGVVVLGRDAARDRAGDDESTDRLMVLGPGASRLLPESRKEMSWRITDSGFAMTLSPRAPASLGANVRGALGGALGAEAGSVAVHPGGPAILDAIEEALEKGCARDIEIAREVLRDHGNMSSPSVLFVLEEFLAQRVWRPINLLAFGPGLTIERITLGPAQAGRSNGVCEG